MKEIEGNLKRTILFIVCLFNTICSFAQRLRQGVDYDDEVPEISYTASFVLFVIACVVFVVVQLVRNRRGNSDNNADDDKYDRYF